MTYSLENYLGLLHQGQWFGFTDPSDKTYANLIILDDQYTKPTEVTYTTWATSSASRDEILSDIYALEGLETPRRLAEATLTKEGKDWLQANRVLIATERDKLS